MSGTFSTGRINAIVLLAMLAMAVVGLGIWFFVTIMTVRPPDEQAILDWDSGDQVKPGPQLFIHGHEPLSQVQHDFGLMPFETDGVHTWELHNFGQETLVFTPPTPMKGEGVLTFNDMRVLPGESTQATMTWTADRMSKKFWTGVSFLTNDPNWEAVDIGVFGRVEEQLMIDPKRGWKIGEIDDDKPSEFRGVVKSAFLDTFQIVAIDSSSENLTARTTRLPVHEVNELESKSGYAVQVDYTGSTVVGLIDESLTIHTDAPEKNTIQVRVTGVRQGPISFLTPFNAKWTGEGMRLELGRFRAEDGKRVQLPLFVERDAATGFDPIEFKLLGFECPEAELAVELKAEESSVSGSRCRFELSVAVPAGRPPDACVGPGTAHLTIATNHPGASKIALNVQFVSH
jgi:hypothetical protein